MDVDFDNLTEAQQESLDELVHEMASQIASNTNNAGPKDQIDFLLMHGMTLENIAREVGSGDEDAGD